MRRGRKKRNYQWRSERYAFAVKKHLDDLYDRTSDKIVVPIEEPYLAGWDVTLTLRDDFARSSEAPFYHRLLQTITSRYYHYSHFIRSPKIVSAIRRDGYTIDSLYKHLVPPATYSQYGYYRGTISSAEYERLSEQDRKPFYKASFPKRGEEYVLREWSYNPRTLFRVKLVKVYHTQRSVPNSEAESEYAKLKDKYWNSDMLCLKHPEGYINYGKSLPLGHKRASRDLVLELTKYYNAGVLDDDAEVYLMYKNKGIYHWKKEYVY